MRKLLNDYIKSILEPSIRYLEFELSDSRNNDLCEIFISKLKLTLKDMLFEEIEACVKLQVVLDHDMKYDEQELLIAAALYEKHEKNN